jgi:hypothetical protein
VGTKVNNCQCFLGYSRETLQITSYNVTFQAKKGWSLSEWSALPRPQKRVLTLRYSPCTATPPAATAPVTTVDNTTNFRKYSFLFPNSPLQYKVVAILPLSLQLRWRPGEGSIGTWAVPRGSNALLSSGPLSAS